MEAPSKFIVNVYIYVPCVIQTPQSTYLPNITEYIVRVNYTMHHNELHPNITSDRISLHYNCSTIIGVDLVNITITAVNDVGKSNDSFKQIEVMNTMSVPEGKLNNSGLLFYTYYIGNEVIIGISISITISIIIIIFIIGFLCLLICILIHMHQNSLESETKNGNMHQNLLESEMKNGSMHQNPFESETKNGNMHQNLLESEMKNGSMHQNPLESETKNGSMHQNSLESETNSVDSDENKVTLI